MVQKEQVIGSEKVEEAEPPTTEQETQVTIVIPTYNERKNIINAIAVLKGAFTNEPHDLTILVVDDDSPDGTAEVVRETCEGDDSVQVVVRPNGSGLASAVACGFVEANGDIVGVMDADLQHPPEHLSKLTRLIDDDIADVAVGSRHTPGGGIEGWPLHRRIISCGADVLTKLSLPQARGLSDPMSGMFAVERSVIENSDLDPEGFKILLEVLVEGDWSAVVEIPYLFRERQYGESKLTAKQYLSFLEHLAMLRVSQSEVADRVEPRRAVRMAEFAVVGGIGAFVNMAVFAAALAFGSHHMAAGIIAFFVALQGNFVGNWLTTFDRPEGSIARQWARFQAVHFGGFGVYSTVLFALVSLASVPALIGNFGAILAGAAINYLGSEKLAFKL